jgi:adenylate cyclase
MTGRTPPPPGDPRNEEFWRDYLSHPDTLMSFGRRVLKRIPASPRCQLCAAPFGGAGGPVMRLIGKAPADGNPNMCNTCQKALVKYHGGAEVEGSMHFADIRGSTTLAEGMSPGEYHAVLNRFYTAASEAVFKHNGIVDKFVGDELVAVFPPVYDANHPERAVEAARSVLLATGHGEPSGPWVPLGAGVHTGRVWFGAVGEGTHVEVTVVGDAVNIAARLASEARAGEILVSIEAAARAGMDPTLERRTLALKGKELATEVVTLTIGPG